VFSLQPYINISTLYHSFSNTDGNNDPTIHRQMQTSQGPAMKMRETQPTECECEAQRAEAQGSEGLWAKNGERWGSWEGAESPIPTS